MRCAPAALDGNSPAPHGGDGVPSIVPSSRGVGCCCAAIGERQSRWLFSTAKESSRRDGGGDRGGENHPTWGKEGVRGRCRQSM